MTDRAEREALVREHMESENRHAFDATLRTFATHPRYEIVAGGRVYDGPAEVAAYYRATRAAFPDQRNDLVSLRHADDAVVVEFDLHGTHLGELYGFPPTGRSFRCRMLALFLFEGRELVCERVYFDALTVLAQLGLAPALPD
ncbi:ester cyclase [Streptomyces sp. WAC06614]|uniref:ester cyclase n=1 Tax=Streptomyces sp. WAC06614 TaxID=2487416 RepID=UPI000F79F216|nr:ester cyclase [Streptomyces sp. WAC06614]RSS84362.1 ester cyclase [Streptomyces sp. WAC06614]